MTISTAVQQSSVARVLGIKTDFRNLKGGVTLLPQRVAVVGQGSEAATYLTTKRQVFSAAEAGTLYGFGSPIHLACRQLLPANGDGVGAIPVTVYPLAADGSGVVSSGDITPTGTATKQGTINVLVNNIPSENIVISVGDTVAAVVTAMTNAINAVLEMPVVATDSTTQVDLDSKWKGASANDIVLSVVGPTDTGITFAATQPVNGASNPDVQDALDQIGNVWETLIVNCLETGDATALTAYSTFGEGRWGALVRKPLMVFSGTTEATVATAIVVPESRKTDRTNVQVPMPGSDHLPLEIAARWVCRVALVSNDNPPQDYGSQNLSGLTPGLDSEQWLYTQKDTAVKGGSSTSDVKDEVPTISDTVTFYHPTGEEPPAYRYVVDIMKVMNIIFNLDLIFATPEWDGAPLIPNDQPTTNRTAKKPYMAVSAMASMVDSLGLEAILSDPATAKDTIQAEINSSNPKRLDATLTVQLSGNTNIKSVDLFFGFFFGTSQVVA